MDRCLLLILDRAGCKTLYCTVFNIAFIPRFFFSIDNVIAAAKVNGLRLSSVFLCPYPNLVVLFFFLPPWNFWSMAILFWRLCISPVTHCILKDGE